MENGTLVTVLNDADISCTGTTEVVYYGKPIPFIFNALWLIAFFDIFSLVATGAGTATVRMFGELSIDGINWTPFSGNLLSVTAPGIARGTATGSADLPYFGPLVRFNIGIKSDVAYPASARLSAVVNVRFF